MKRQRPHYCPFGHCLCRTLQGQSRRIWYDLHDADMLSTPFHEDTVTQNLALHLNRQHPRENRVHVFSRSDESKNGSDFLWMIFDQAANKHLLVVVQAKRLYPSGRYEAFKSGQVNLASDYAESINGAPYYLFYGYPRILSGLWNGWKGNRPGWPVPFFDYPRDLGLLLSPANKISNFKDGRLTPTDISQNCFPMWLPFCTCSVVPSKDILGGIKEEFLATGHEEASVGGSWQPIKTPGELQGWVSGKKMTDDELDRAFKKYEGEFETFQPDFVLGTVVSGGDP